MDEADYLPLSSLSQYLWCQRRCALIHIEQVWVENLFTAEGRVMHEKAHEERFQESKGVRVERGVALCSKRLGLNGKADVVEFHGQGKDWLAFPVEYKRGKPKSDDCDLVQLCAQCLCLEEMLGARIPEGAIFYGRPRRRFAVSFDDELRRKTEETVRQAHAFISAGITPKPEYMKKCESCSLMGICMPRSMGHALSMENYFKEALKEE
ncbi:MAG: CRISPR-associated protein Cas4 [Candidatus Omnitrophica bacterium]|nr:CRISPR-associated protein Cas4 [Candidatus Omnitrophota bacterium]